MNRRTPLFALTLFALLPLTPASSAAQELTLVHRSGEHPRVAGMSVREFASGLRMVTRGEAPSSDLVCHVAVVDGEGNVWEEWASEPFQPGSNGDLEGACVPRVPMTERGAFADGDQVLAVEGGVDEAAFFDGLPEWEFVIKELDKSIPGAGRTAATKPIDKASPLLVFLLGPAGGEDMEEVAFYYSTRPVMVAMSGR